MRVTQTKVVILRRKFTAKCRQLAFWKSCTQLDFHNKFSLGGTKSDQTAWKQLFKQIKRERWLL